MATTNIKVKRSSVEGKIPLTTDLALGEFAVNTYDGKLFLKRDNGISQHIVEVGGNQGFYVKNQSGALISKGTLVGFVGTVGNSGKLLVAPFLANGSTPSEYFMGVVSENIPNGGDGFVIDHGTIYNLDTSAWAAGTVLYASSTVPGAFTSTLPQAPNNKITVAAVVNSHQNVGVLEVRVTLGSKLQNDELVELGTLAQNHTLAYNATNSRFENTALKTVNGQSLFGSGDISSTTGVNSFNTRSGAVTLTSSDVTSALGYTPYNSTNPSGYITSSALTPYITSATAASTYQPLDADLTSIAGLAGTSGLLKKTAANTWSLDTNTYLTGNQSITLSGDATGSGTTAIALTLANSGVTAGTYTKVTVDAKGRTTSGTTLSASDIPSLDASKITTGTLDAARLPSYVDDVLEYTNLTSFPASGETGKIYVALDTNKTYRWSGSTYVYITSGAVDSVAGKTGVVTLVKGDVGLGNVDNTADSAKNVLSATKLTTARTINGVLFDGTANITVADSTKLPLAGGTMTGVITFAGAQTWPTFNQNTTGSAATLTTGRTIGMTGDVTWTSASFNGSANVTGTATLANSGVTVGTYTKVTVDAKGRVTTGTTLASDDLPTYTGTITSSQVTTALGYTPYNSTNPSGYQTASNINSYFGSATTSGTLDWNDVSNTKPGAYGTLLLGSATNGPGGGTYYHPFNLEYSSKNGTGNVTQMAIAYGSPGNELYMRGRYSGSWTGWVRYLNSSNYTSYSPSLTGSGASGTWDISITGSSASTTGNAATATALQTARTINGVSFNGTANITVADSTKLPLSGGTLTGVLSSNKPINLSNATYGTQANLVGNWSGAGWWGLGSETGHIIKLDQVASADTAAPTWVGATDVTLKLGTKTVLDSGNYNSYSPSLTGSGATGTWGISITGSSASTTGNAATATALQTARTINGVSFNGTANITVADSTKLPLSGGTLTGNLSIDTANGEILVTPTGWRSTDRAAIKIRSKADTPAEIDLRHTVSGVESGWHISARGAAGDASELHFYRFNMTAAGAADAAGSFVQMFAFKANGSFNTVGAITQNGSQVLHAGNYSSYALPLSGGTLTGGVTLNAGRFYVSSAASGQTYGGTIHIRDAEATGANNSFAGIAFSSPPGADYVIGKYSNSGTGYLQIRNHLNTAIWTMSIDGTTTHYGEHYIPTLTVGGLGRSASHTIGANLGSGAISWNNAQLEIKNSDAGSVGLALHRAGYTSNSISVTDGNGIRIDGNIALHAGNYTSYSPSLTGGGASGTWGINVTGSAGSAPYLTGGDSAFYGLLYTSLGGDLNTYNSPGLYSAEYTGSTNRPVASNGHYIQISDAGGTDVKTQWYFENTGVTPYMRLMWGGGNWKSWQALLTSGNYTSYALPLSGGTLSGNLRVNAGIQSGADMARPLAQWSATSATGMVYFELPGTTSNYGMVHAVIDIYEYSSNSVSTVIVGGHNWNGAWYNVGANVIGQTDKAVRLGVRGGKYVICIGSAGSSWSYGTVVLRKIHNGGYYSGIMDMGAAFVAAITTSESLTSDTGDLRALRTPAGFNAGGTITQAGNQVLHAGNYTSYSPSLTGSGASGTWGISITGNAATAYGLAVHTGRNNEANKVVRTDGSGYIQAGWINTTSGDNGTTAIDRVYASSDGYIRYYTPANFRQVLDVPTRTGGSASGTWSINVTGSAGSATTASQLGGISSNRAVLKRRSRIHTSDGTSLNSSITAPEMGFTYGGSGEPTGPYIAFGGLGGDIDYSCQLVGSYNGGGNDFKIRTRNDDTASWNAWRTIVTDGNYTSYAVGVTNNSTLNSDTRNTRGVTRLYRRDDNSDYSVQTYWTGSYWRLYGYNGDSAHADTQVGLADRATRANGNFYIDDNYGCGIVGAYASTRYQGVFFMGDSYKMSADGTSLSNMYGIAWSHPNAGGAAGNLTDHGMLIINNGGFRCAISNSIVASGNVTAYSDERLKTNWRDMPDNYVARLAQVKVGIYDRTDEQELMTQVGVGAQSFQQLLPQAIITAKDEMGTLSVSYGNAALASAVELAKDNVELRARIERLESIIEQLLNKE